MAVSEAEPPWQIEEVPPNEMLHCALSSEANAIQPLNKNILANAAFMTQRDA
jgi:hypothetical protein